MPYFASASLALVIDHDPIHAILAGVAFFVMAFVGFRVAPWIRRSVRPQESSNKMLDWAGPVLLCIFGVVLVVGGLAHP